MINNKRVSIKVDSIIDIYILRNRDKERFIWDDYDDMETVFEYYIGMESIGDILNDNQKDSIIERLNEMKLSIIK